MGPSFGDSRDEILWFGETPEPDANDRLEAVGDLWHSGLLRGTAGGFSELRYWQPVWWWYLNDGPSDRRCVSWRVDPTGFAIRRSAWEALGGLDSVYRTDEMRAFDLGFRLLRQGGVPLHLPGILPAQEDPIKEGGRSDHDRRLDRYLFFVRHFKRGFRLFMFFRESILRGRPIREWRALRGAEHLALHCSTPLSTVIPRRPLMEVGDPQPRVSVIIPTFRRQRFARQLINDLHRQTVQLHQIIVVDQTPENEREQGVYEVLSSPVTEIHWQREPGSCLARNKAIRRCTGDFILFADDDTRVPPDYVENHIRLLKSYGAEATNGIVINADDPEQDLSDLERKRASAIDQAQGVYADHKFGNSNSCVRREWVNKLVGNDANFDGGYGEDTDFGHRIVEHGGVVLFNPYSVDLHLKPPDGGYRWWEQSRKARKPWELRREVGWIKPRPSPTIMYGFLKHYDELAQREWLWLYLLRGWWPRSRRRSGSTALKLVKLPWRIVQTPLVLLRIRESRRFARDLLALGPRYE